MPKIKKRIIMKTKLKFIQVVAETRPIFKHECCNRIM